MKKVGLIVFIILIAALIIGVFSSCSVEQSLDYNDVIESRFGDSFEIVSSTNAPDGAIEYPKAKRVTKEILIDTRIVGVHLTGLYLPAGESATITIDQAEIASNHKVLINQNLDGENVDSSWQYLNSEVTTIQRGESGGLIEIEIDKAQLDTFIIKISGCIESGYYRYGIDNENSALINQGNYLTYDASNVRLYIPMEFVENVNDIKSALIWWRNSMIFMDKLFELSWFSGDLSPIRIYAQESQGVEVLPDSKSIIIAKEYAHTMISYEKLSSGDDAKVLEILKAIALEKYAKSSKFDNSILKDSLCDIVASITYANMVDFNQASKIDKNNILFNSKCVEKVLKNDFSDDSEKQLYFMMNLYHSFGEDVVYELIEKLEDVDSIDEELNIACKVCRYDLECFETMFDTQTKAKEEIDFERFYLVANNLTMGMYNFLDQSGLVVLADQKTIFNFGENIVGENWVVVEVKGASGRWEKIDDGVYQYSPSKDKLRDNFELILTNDDITISLKNNITVDVKIASRVVYCDVEFDTLDDAIKKYSTKSVDIKESIQSASVIKEDVLDEEKRSFAITSGWLEVPKDDNYTIYIKCSGLIRVEFGVEDYITQIFNNSLTVPAYTHELSYKVKLKKGFEYFFRIYDLSNSGAGYATLGLAGSDGIIHDIDEDYLIAPNLKRSNIVSYVSPKKQIDALTMQNETFLEGEIRSISYSGIKDYKMGETSADINANDDVKVVITYINISYVDIVGLSVGEKMDGVKIKIYNEGVLLKENVLSAGDNFFDIERVRTSSLILEFTSDNIFNLQIQKIYVRENQPRMTIVPSTSRSIEFIGEWYTDYSYIAINGSLVVSKSDNSAMSYSFNGNKLVIFATRGPDFGSATVYIDGVAQSDALSLYSADIKCAQLVYNINLKDGDHTIRIVADGDAPINVDYLAVANKGETVTKNDFSKLWYVTFIPAIVIIGGIICLILDKKEKKKSLK